jgi:hypothetical protein
MSLLDVAILVVVLNWAIPLVACGAYGLWGYCAGDFVYAGHYGPFIKLRLSYKMLKWHDRLWRDWSGVGLFLFMVYRDELGPEDDSWVARTVVHEGTHCWHWLWLGSMFYVAYLAHMIFIYFFQKDKHPYLDCWSERLARKHAGQLVDIPKEQWPDGPYDRNPWW